MPFNKVFAFLIQVSIKTARLLRPGNSLRCQVRCATGEEVCGSSPSSSSSLTRDKMRQLASFSAQLVRPKRPSALEAKQRDEEGEKRINYSQVRVLLCLLVFITQGVWDRRTSTTVQTMNDLHVLLSYWE